MRGREVEVRLSVNLSELDLLLSLDRNLNAEVEPDELEAKREAIVAYLGERIAVQAETRLPMEPPAFGIGRSADGAPTFEARLRFRAAQPLERFSIRCEPLTELGADHRILATVRREGRSEPFVFQRGVLYEGRPPSVWATAGQFVVLGIRHIAVGYDHVAFLLALLLTGGRLLHLVTIVTAFTVAHSVTLALAALELVTLPERLVESGIALSVAYVALENLRRRPADRRWVVSFLFGLVHGFGFANVLKEMDLSRAVLASSLFFFNAGVEVGQIVLVALLVPVVAALRRTPAHGMAVRLASAAIFSLGAFWFVQRAF